MITIWPDEDDDDPEQQKTIRYCGHPIHTARAKDPCDHRSVVARKPVWQKPPEPAFVDLPLLRIERESEKAWLGVRQNGKQDWFPKSHVKLVRVEGKLVAKVPRWLAKKKELLT